MSHASRRYHWQNCWQRLRDSLGAVRPPLKRRLARVRPELERLEDRTAPAAAGLLSFAPASGLLSMDDTAGTAAAQVSLSARGYVQIMLDSVMHSSDPTAVAYDGALAGARAGTLHTLDFQGSAQATLVLDALSVPGSLAIVSDQAVSVRGALDASALLSVSAPSLDVPAAASLTAPTVQVSADVLTLEGTISADGRAGGGVAIYAGAMIQAGAITADGSAGAGGSIDVQFSRNYIASSAALLQADGITEGGSIVVNGGRLFTSGSDRADGLQGGTVELLGQTVIVAAGSVDTSGTDGGGTAIIGGTRAGLPGVSAAQTVTITQAAVIHADALQAGNGGQVRVWSTQETDFGGTATATGGAVSGAGGVVELSSARTLNDSGQADAGAAHGAAGHLLLDPQNLVISAASFPFLQLDLVNPGNGTEFGEDTVALPDGNMVVTDPTDSITATNAGAVYLFDSQTGALISTLTGSNVNDAVGSGGVTVLSTGNYVVDSSQWASNRGAVTWGSGTTGVTGAVSATNSLVGSIPGDSVGSGRVATFLGQLFVLVPGVTPLSNGNYVIDSPNWDGNFGATTWGSGSAGVVGQVSETNSVIGSTAGDYVGYNLAVLSNGNYVVSSPSWSNSAGEATWCNGSSPGTSGIVSAINSLVGSTSDSGDEVGSSVTALSNGNYVVDSPQWGVSQFGAVTWGNGSTGTSGAVSNSNSLFGPVAKDQVGSGGVTALPNGNYVVDSPDWGNNFNRVFDTLIINDFGAVTWGNGSVATSGAVSSANSVVGTNQGDQVGSGNNEGFNGVTILSNGNYVIDSSLWDNNTGAVTWASGSSPTSFAVATTNSLTGVNSGFGSGDNIGGGRDAGGVYALTNGNYVVSSPNWDGGGSSGLGAVTWGDGITGTTGTVSAANSIIGSDPGDNVGAGGGSTAAPGVVPLANGNYVVDTAYWNGGFGAVTWASGSEATSEVVSAANSLVGSSPDLVGFDGLTPLTNGNYVVDSSPWNSGDGAVTWGNGNVGTSGVVSQDNSIVGSSQSDAIGDNGVLALKNGNYVIDSPRWTGFTGAVTFGNGNVGTSGVVSADNSLVGSEPGDAVGTLDPDTEAVGVILLSNGNYVVDSPLWDNNTGAVTWGNGSAGISGVVSDANSLVGTVSDQGGQTGDSVGIGGIAPLNNGDYLVISTDWNDSTGAATLVNGVTGQTSDGSNSIGAQNSVVGANVNSGLVGSSVQETAKQALLASFAGDSPAGAVVVAPLDATSIAFGFQAGQHLDLAPTPLAQALAGGTDITLQASNDITIDDPITVNDAGAAGSLTLQAGRSILINASISTGNGNLTLVANDTLLDGVNNSDRQPGAAVVSMAPGTSIDAGTGQVSIMLLDDTADAKTNAASGAIALQAIDAGALQVVNSGLSPGSDIDLDGAIDTGAGAQSFQDANGAIRPDGTGRGTLPLTGRVSFAGPSTLAVSIDGTTAGSQFAQVQALPSYAGSINLANLALSVSFGFTPAVGDVWTIIRAGAVSGTFAQGSYLTVGARVLQIVYGPSSVALVYVSALPVAVKAVAGSGQKAAVTTTFASPLKALVTDAAGNPVSGVTVVFSVPGAGASASFAGTASFTAITNAAGVAVASAPSANTVAGAYAVTATVAGATAPAKFSLTNTAGAAAVLAPVPPVAAAMIGKTFAPLKVQVLDVFGNPVAAAGIKVTFTVVNDTSSGAGAKFAGGKTTAQVATSAAGQAVMTALTANPKVGTFAVTLSASGLAAPQSFVLSNTAAPPADPLVSGPQSAVVGQLYAAPLTAVVHDRYGNPVAGVKVTFTAPAGGAGGTFASARSATVTTNAAGLATAPAFSANTTAGRFQVQVMAQGDGIPAWIALTNAPGAATRIEAVGGTKRTSQLKGNVGTPLQVLVLDAFGNVVAGAAVTFTVEPDLATGASASFAGAATVTVSSSVGGLAVAPPLTGNGKRGTFQVAATVAGLAEEIVFQVIAV